jgi:hypothetical protein
MYAYFDLHFCTYFADAYQARKYFPTAPAPQKVPAPRGLGAAPPSLSWYTPTSLQDLYTLLVRFFLFKLFRVELQFE